jgi:hypothetical protein
VYRISCDSLKGGKRREAFIAGKQNVLKIDKNRIKSIKSFKTKRK